MAKVYVILREVEGKDVIGSFADNDVIGVASSKEKALELIKEAADSEISYNEGVGFNDCERSEEYGGWFVKLRYKDEAFQAKITFYSIKEELDQLDLDENKL